VAREAGRGTTVPAGDAGLIITRGIQEKHYPQVSPRHFAKAVGALQNPV
jgi:hypothetical protein